MRIEAMQPQAFAKNFAIRLSEIRAEVEPIRRGNVARAENLFKLRLASALGAFKPEFVFDPLIPSAQWILTFPDKSIYEPDLALQKILRKMLDTTPPAQRAHNRERSGKGRRHEARV